MQACHSGLLDRAVEQVFQVGAHAERKRDIDCCKTVNGSRESSKYEEYAPQPRIPAMPMALTWKVLSAHTTNPRRTLECLQLPMEQQWKHSTIPRLYAHLSQRRLTIASIPATRA
jgi:hypothetical protein